MQFEADRDKLLNANASTFETRHMYIDVHV